MQRWSGRACRERGCQQRGCRGISESLNPSLIHSRASKHQSVCAQTPGIGSVGSLPLNNFSRREQEHPWEGKDPWQVGSHLLRAQEVLFLAEKPKPKSVFFSQDK